MEITIFTDVQQNFNNEKVKIRRKVMEILNTSKFPMRFFFAEYKENGEFLMSISVFRLRLGEEEDYKGV